MMTESTTGAKHVGRRRSGRPSAGDTPVGIKAVDQALQLLDQLANCSNQQSLMELSRACGMEPSKLHRYLVSLGRSGLVAKTEHGLYELGPGAISLGGRALAKIDELIGFETMLGDFVEQLNESAFLYVWTMGGPVMVRTKRPNYAPIALRVGTIAPLVGSASGPVFAAFLPSEQVRQIFVRDAQAAGIHVEEAWRSLIEEVAPRIRRDLVNISATTLLPTSGACAAPVFDVQGDLLYVVGVSVRTVGAILPAHEVAARVRALGLEMSHRLGFSAAKIHASATAS